MDDTILPCWGSHGKIERSRRTLLPRRHVDVSRAATVSVGLLRAWRQEPGFLELWLQMRSGSEGAKTVTDTVVAADAITIAAAGLGMKPPTVKYAIANRAPIVLSVLVHQQSGFEHASELLRSH